MKFSLHRLAFSAYVFLIFALNLATSSSVSAIEVTSDQGAMPRCLSVAGQLGNGLLIHWNSADHYGSKIRVGRIEDITREAALKVILPFRGHLTCADWNWILKSKVELHWTELPAGATEALGYPIPDTVTQALAQVRLGGTVYRTETTAQDYWHSHSSELESGYNLELNRTLTHKYGAGFVGSLYREVELNNPKNQELRTQVRAHLDANARTGGQGIQPLKEKFKNYTVLVGGGLGNNNEAGRLKPLVDFLRGQDVRVVPFATKPLARIAANSAAMEKQIRAHLQNGERLILFAASKSVPEALAAIARIQQNPDLPLPGKTMGSIDGFINLSGVIQGSQYANWFAKLKGKFLIDLVAKIAAKLFGAPTSDLDVFRELSTASIKNWMELNQVPTQLPQSTVYISLLGVLSGDGKSSDESIAQLRDAIARKYMQQYGANDGYVEYPGSVLPAQWAPRHYTAVFDASHVLSDGSYDGISMSKQPNLVYTALFQTLSDLITVAQKSN